jgi:endonuclease V-like protein UPF0215 family
MPWESVVACDDGYVRKLGEGYTVVACIDWVIGRGPASASTRPVRVDGLEAGSIIAGILGEALQVFDVKALLLDSLTIAGFNLVSPSTIERLVGVPTLVVYKYKPSPERLIRTVREKFADWAIRARVVSLVGEAREVETRRGRLYVIPWGMGLGEAAEIIGRLQLYSRVPEPLRLAHYMASSVSRLFEKELSRLEDPP